MFFFCCAAGFSFAQSIKIERLDVRGNKVIVWYNLKDTNYNRKYSINLYSSRDEFTYPLFKVSGDVGNDVKAGDDKKIIWDITSELGNFKGGVTLEIRGNVVAPFIQLSESEKRRSYKKGKEYLITWTSGNLDGHVHIELYKQQQMVWEVNNLSNNGKYSWIVPGNLKTGNDYRFKFSNVNDPTDFRFSSKFAIRPKVPMALKVGAVAVLGAGAAVLGGGKSSSSNSLANPPSLPGN
jgi:hypothetical protein